MNIKDEKKLLAELKEELIKEIRDCDFSAVCNDYDILENIKAYIELSELLNDEKLFKSKIEKVEKSVLRQFGATKITKEDGLSFYVKKGEAYDSEGNLIEDMYDEYIDNDDLFCDYLGDDIYSMMKKYALAKARNRYKDEY